MEVMQFNARIISQNRITIDEEVVQLMGLRVSDIVKVTVEKLKQ